MSAPVTEAHRKLAADLCRNATGSNRALHHVPKFAQLIAESEAKAVEAERARLYGIGRKKGEQPVSSDMDIGHRCLSGDKWPQPVDPIAECARLGRELADSITERDQLRAELEKVYALVTPDGCDLAPRGLFETARAVAELRAEMERLKPYVSKAVLTHEGTMLCSPLVAVKFNEQTARAESAEREVERLTAEVGMLRGYDCGAMQEAEDGPTPDGECGVCIKCLRARAERAEASLHALRLICGTTDANKFSTWVDRAIARAEKAEAELATERARVDQLILTHPLYDSRDQLDAAMKEGA